MVEVIPLETPSLGDRSYVAHDGDLAMVVDPQRDVDRVLDAVDRHGLTITHVLETHVHNDYITGGYALARRTGATYVVAAADAVEVEHHGVEDLDEVANPSFGVRALATPGHTFTHLSYALLVDDQVDGVFTGGSLLFGSTGRPDLMGDEHAETLARHQYDSAHRLVERLPGATPVYPTHGFGSFCASGTAEGDASTLADEAQANDVLTRPRDEWVADLLDSLGPYPAYYQHMAPRNLRGPDAPDLAPPDRVDPAELRRRIDAGEWVVDVRSGRPFAAGHVRGTINVGLDGSFPTYVGWLVPWGTPVTLLGPDPDAIAEAQRELVRIGVDRPAGAATGEPADWAGDGDLGSYDTARFADLAEVLSGERGDDPHVVDVRLPDEWRDGHIDGARHVPLHTLEDRLGDLPRDATVWVHCGGGYRSAIAASLMARGGIRPVLIDEPWDAALDSGLPITGED